MTDLQLQGRRPRMSWGIRGRSIHLTLPRGTCPLRSSRSAEKRDFTGKRRLRESCNLGPMALVLPRTGAETPGQSSAPPSTLRVGQDYRSVRAAERVRTAGCSPCPVKVRQRHRTSQPPNHTIIASTLHSRRCEYNDNKRTLIIWYTRQDMSSCAPTLLQ